jgi:ABC-type dipeptide/oligopeptide/nickel transport system permease subunit
MEGVQMTKESAEALNAATWEFIEAAKALGITPLGGPLWNNLKLCLAPAIAKYVAVKTANELGLNE